ncbi:hypothetical protein SAMN05216411_11843 [Nitrosospira multiformis]|nr:hypothetical protein SAMN05216411_11843 [Nitrosospira multiformis]
MENFVCVRRRAVSKGRFSKDLPTPCPLPCLALRLGVVAIFTQQLLVAVIIRSPSPQWNDVIHFRPESSAGLTYSAVSMLDSISVLDSSATSLTLNDAWTNMLK